MRASTWEQPKGVIADFKRLIKGDDKNPYMDIVNSTVNMIHSTEKTVGDLTDKKEQMDEQHFETARSFNRMAIDATNHEQYLEVIKEGLKAFGELEEKWSDLTMYFESMAILIENGLGMPMNNFYEYGKLLQRLKLEKNHDLSNLQKRKLMEPMNESVRVGFMVHHLSGTYMQV